MSNLKAFGEALKEGCYIGSLSEAEQKKYYLIVRYENRVSDRLLREKELLYAEGSEAFGEMLKEVMNYENPFLKHMKEASKKWEGKSYPVPVIYGTQDGVKFGTISEVNNTLCTV